MTISYQNLRANLGSSAGHHDLLDGPWGDHDDEAQRDCRHGA